MAEAWSKCYLQHVEANMRNHNAIERRSFVGLSQQVSLFVILAQATSV